MEITGATSVYCIIGYPIGHALSPVVHNAGFRDRNLDCVYVAFPLKPEDMEVGLKGLAVLGVKGMSVTVPLKELAYKYIDEADESAHMTGAVNTILINDGRMKGFNLDVDGVKFSLEKLDLEEGARKAVVLGAGGAARAVVAALLQHRVKEIVVLNRTVEKAERVKEFFESKGYDAKFSSGGIDSESVRNELADADILINTTPVGMYPNVDGIPIDPDSIPGGIKVLDAIYRPQKTRLLEEAEKRGCQTLCGIDWLVHQGVIAFKIWTGEELNKDLVLKILAEKFGD